jgi:ParB family chromosome partitioning protein
MTTSRPNAEPLLAIDPDKIRKNPDNPRMIFREQEMNELLQSISEVGIQVPLTVYEDRGYVILDGERRWRCAKRLNFRTIPCIIHPKPSRLENLLMMFNIHNVRVQWDIMPMAYKIANISDLLIKEGQDVSPKALSAITGVRLPTVKRCLELLDLPKRYRDLLMAEAEKPKGEQKITADLFIEINKSYNVVERYVPETASSFDKAEFVDSMVDKYVSGSVGSVTAFRDLSKLARAERAGVDREEAVKAIKKLVHNKRYSVKDAYRDTVEIAYEKRDLLAKIDGLRTRIADLRGPLARSRELVAALRALRSQIDKLLK